MLIAPTASNPEERGVPIVEHGAVEVVRELILIVSLAAFELEQQQIGSPSDCLSWKFRIEVAASPPRMIGVQFRAIPGW